MSRFLCVSVGYNMVGWRRWWPLRWKTSSLDNFVVVGLGSFVVGFARIIARWRLDIRSYTTLTKEFLETQNVTQGYHLNCKQLWAGSSIPVSLYVMSSGMCRLVDSLCRDTLFCCVLPERFIWPRWWDNSGRKTVCKAASSLRIWRRMIEHCPKSGIETRKRTTRFH